MRRLSAGKRDTVEAEIITAFEAAGGAVLTVSSTGAPDLVVFHRGRVFLVEVKARRGTLTPQQVAFHAAWRGPTIHIVRSVEDALTLVLSGTLAGVGQVM